MIQDRLSEPQPKKGTGIQPSGKYKTQSVTFLPKEKTGMFERTITAAHKLLYSEEAKELIERQFSSEGPIEKKLAEAVTALMLLIAQRAKPQMPGDVLFMAAIEMLFEMMDYLTKGGVIQPLDEAQTKLATQSTLGMLAMKSGATKEQTVQMLKGEFQQPGQIQPQVA